VGTPQAVSECANLDQSTPTREVYPRPLSHFSSPPILPKKSIHLISVHDALSVLFVVVPNESFYRYFIIYGRIAISLHLRRADRTTSSFPQTFLGPTTVVCLSYLDHTLVILVTPMETRSEKSVYIFYAI
jgi:hypothetical protein